MYVSYAGAQSLSLTADSNAISATKIIKTDTSLKKNTLYSLGIDWFVNVLNNPKLMIQMQDRDAGIIIAKCALTYTDTVKLSTITPTTYSVTEVKYLIKLSFKDGKVKYDIYNFITKDGTIIKNGKAIVGGVPMVHIISKEKLESLYKQSYINAQIACKNECLSVGNSITAYFSKQQGKNDW